MAKQAGLCIDHRKAVIVIITEGGEETREMPSNMDKHIRFSGGDGSENRSTEDVRDRQFGNHLNDFYEKVIAEIHDAGTIQISGPGEAKGELSKRLVHDGYKGNMLAVETMDKMTDRQISAKVRDRFPA
ncbi:MAG: hypothetical protein JXR32_05985 [Anaerolineaceae bacterium]|nr:hypothetical protein [Anaerolineaceae bacterium]